MTQTRSNQLLFRYGCGCIGFRPFLDGSILFVKFCDDTEYCLRHGVPGSVKKQYVDCPKALTWKEQMRTFAEIGHLTSLGGDMKELHRLIRRNSCPVDIMPEPELSNTD